MPEILINVINKIPVLSGDVRQITADNGDYTVRLVFDDDWTDGEKTVLFVRENGFVYPAAVTKNNTAAVPRVSGVAMREWLYVGVKQGDVHTSRPCGIPVYRAITDMIDDDAVQPDESLWESVILRIEELEKNGGGGDASGKADKPVSILVDLAEDNSFVIPDHTAEELLEMSQNGEVRLTAYRANEDGSAVVMMADIRGDLDVNNGMLYTIAADMQITSVPVLVWLNTNYENTNGVVLAAPAGGTVTSSGGALNLYVMTAIPKAESDNYEAVICDRFDLSSIYTYEDIKNAFIAKRPITLMTYDDANQQQYGFFNLFDLHAEGGGTSALVFHGHYWNDDRETAYGWKPAIAKLFWDGTFVVKDAEWHDYAKQAEVDSLSKAIANLPQSDDDEIEMLIAADLLPAVTTASGAILTNNSGNVILRY